MKSDTIQPPSFDSGQPTMQLRQMIEDSKFGVFGESELHNALLRLEHHLGLEYTESIEPQVVGEDAGRD